MPQAPGKSRRVTVIAGVALPPGGRSATENGLAKAAQKLPHHVNEAQGILRVNVVAAFCDRN